MMCLALGLRWSNGTYFPKKGSDTKVFEGNVPQSVLDSLGLK